MKSSSHLTVVNPFRGSGELYTLFAGSEQTSPAHHVGPQVLDYYLLHYVVSGKGSYMCRGKQYELSAGDSFFIFPGELESYTSDPDDPWCYRWVGFNGHYTDSILIKLGITPESPICTKHDEEATLEHWFVKILDILLTSHPGCDLEASGYLRVLLSKYHTEQDSTPRKRSEVDRQMDKVVHWLTVQYARPVSIDDICRTLGYHRSHLTKLFKRYTGMSPMNYLLKIRMERAVALMSDGLTMKQIASSVGYADPLYFSKQFKKWYGTSPSEYQQKLSDGPTSIC